MFYVIKNFCVPMGFWLLLLWIPARHFLKTEEVVAKLSNGGEWAPFLESPATFLFWTPCLLFPWPFPVPQFQTSFLASRISSCSTSQDRLDFTVVTSKAYIYIYIHIYTYIFVCLLVCFCLFWGWGLAFTQFGLASSRLKYCNPLTSATWVAGAIGVYH